MSQIIRSANEQGARARSERRVTQGRVVAVDPLAHTARLDVNLEDTLGAPNYMEGVPFAPQSPPSVGDGVTIGYTNSSAHSAFIIGGRLGGGNQQNTITTVGGVTSLAAAGQPKITGDVMLAAGTNCALVQTGNSITINVVDIDPAAGVTVEIDGANATAAPRATLNLKTGKGVSLDVVDVPASGRADVTINSLFGTILPTKIAFAASPYTVLSGDFAVFCDTTGGAITVTLPAPAANGGRLIVVMNTGANAVTVASAAGSVVGISSIVHTSGATAVWYISDGTNWYSMTNSAGN